MERQWLLTCGPWDVIGPPRRPVWPWSGFHCRVVVPNIVQCVTCPIGVLSELGVKIRPEIGKTPCSIISPTFSLTRLQISSPFENERKGTNKCATSRRNYWKQQDEKYSDPSACSGVWRRKWLRKQTEKVFFLCVRLLCLAKAQFAARVFNLSPMNSGKQTRFRLSAQIDLMWIRTGSSNSRQGHTLTTAL